MSWTTGLVLAVVAALAANVAVVYLMTRRNTNCTGHTDHHATIHPYTVGCACYYCVRYYATYRQTHGDVNINCVHDNCSPNGHDHDGQYVQQAVFDVHNHDNEYVLQTTFDVHDHPDYVTRDELRQHDGVLGRVLNILYGILFGAVIGFFVGLILNWVLPRSASEFHGVNNILFGADRFTSNIVLYNHLAKFGFVLGSMFTCAVIGGLIMMAVVHFRARRDAQQSSNQGA